MKLTISDLIYINEAAKCLKHRCFAFINNTIIGLDNLQVYICTVNLDPSRLSNVSLYGLIFDQRELSKFIKSLSVESSFEINDKEDGITMWHTQFGDTEIPVTVSKNIMSFVISRHNKVHEIDDNIKLYNNQSEDITIDLIKLFSMKKTDGTFEYVYKDRYYMTLFSGLLPLNKSDKIFISIYDNVFNTTYITRFSVKKSKFIVNIYVSYLKV